MANHTYQCLVELQSLDTQIKKHLDLCEEEKRRLAHVDKLRKREEARLDEAKTLDQQLHLREREIESKLHEIGKVLEQNQSHQLAAKSESQVAALESEQSRFSAQRDELEEEEFSILEQREVLEKTIAECQTFINGSNETLSEVKAEVDEICAKEQGQINNLELRRTSLLEEIPKDFRQVFEGVLKAHRFQSPLSFIMDRKCGKCHFSLDSMLASDVFTGSSPALCPGCKRLLIDRAAI